MKGALKEAAIVTKTTSFVIVPVLLVAALLAAVILPGMASHAPDINISLPAAQAAVPANELEFDGFVLSTRHGDSSKVIAGLLSLPAISSNGNNWELKPGQIQIWAGIHPKKSGWGTLAIVWANSNEVWYAAVEAPLTSGDLPNAIRVAPGQFVNATDLRWSAAWIMSRNTKGAGRLLDDPAQYLTLGEGWVRWLELKTSWGLNLPVAKIPFLPPPPGGN